MKSIIIALNFKNTPINYYTIQGNNIMKYYILNKNRRWQRAYRAGYNSFVLKGSENIIRCFDDYQVKEKY